jgi:hypothetical protein
MTAIKVGDEVEALGDLSRDTGEAAPRKRT